MKWLIGWFVFMGLLSSVQAQGLKLVNTSSHHAQDSLQLKLTKKTFRPVDLRYNYYDNLGAVCKAEFKLEKATKIPFRFRLGSLAQTDYMECKPNALKPE